MYRETLWYLQCYANGLRRSHPLSTKEYVIGTPNNATPPHRISIASSHEFKLASSQGSGHTRSNIIDVYLSPIVCQTKNKFKHYTTGNYNTNRVNPRVRSTDYKIIECMH